MGNYQVFAGRGKNRKPMSRRMTKAQATSEAGRMRKTNRTDTGKLRATLANPRVRKVSEGKRKTPTIRKQQPMRKVKTTAAGRAQDRKRKALAPGQRTSKSGRKYNETRSNRSDTKSRHY